MFCYIFFNLNLRLLKKFIAIILMGLQEGAEGNIRKRDLQLINTCKYITTNYRKYKEKEYDNLREQYRGT